MKYTKCILKRYSILVSRSGTWTSGFFSGIGIEIAKHWHSISRNLHKNVKPRNQTVAIICT